MTVQSYLKSPQLNCGELSFFPFLGRNEAIEKSLIEKKNAFVRMYVPSSNSHFIRLRRLVKHASINSSGFRETNKKT